MIQEHNGYPFTIGVNFMDKDLAKEFDLVSEESLPVVKFIEECMDIYQRTLEAAGIFPEEPKAQAIDNSEVDYKNSPSMEAEYAHISKNY